MKIFSAHFVSESGDNYYFTIKANSEPSEKQILKAIRPIVGEETNFIGLNNIYEIDERTTILVKSIAKKK